MDFRLDDDQLALQDTVRTFCRSRYPLEGVAERATGPFDRARFGELAELGVFSILESEARNGLGLGVVEAALVFEQLGEHLVPGPLLWSALAATYEDGAVDGTVAFGGAVDDGAPAYVEHAAEIDALLVLRPAGVAVIDRADLPPSDPLDGLDPLNPIGAFPELPAGRIVGDAAAARRSTLVATALTAAQQLGVAQAALDVAVAYSLEREQFGVPIGSFQALKHMMADMFVRVGLARSAVYAAGAVLDDPGVGDAGRAVGGAKLLAGEAALDNARAAVQVQGGMGFTWEMAPNFLLKRAWVLEESFGPSSTHALALADALAGEAR